MKFIQTSIRFSILLSFLFLFQFCSDQSGSVSYEQFGDSILVSTSGGDYSFVFLDEDIVSVSHVSDSIALPPSHAIVLKRQGIAVEVETSGKTLSLNTEKLQVQISDNPLRISYLKGEKTLITETGFYQNSEGIGFEFEITEDEALYGGGERALGMDRRGNRLELYNTPSYGYEEVRDLMYYSMPIVASSQQYMLLWDNPQKGHLDLGKASSIELQVGAIGGRRSYTVVGGDDFYDMVSNFNLLTGRQPMVPRWVLGNFSSRFGYHSQEETESTIAKFREDKIPVDGVVIDIFWFGKDIKGHMGKLDWDYEFWPKPVEMIENLKEDGVNTVLITEPFILKTSDKWDEAVEKGVLCVDKNGDPYVFEFYFGQSGLIDVFNPVAVEWFWDIYKKHTETGVTSWWGDLGEPEAHPDDLLHYGGLRAPEVHNIYGHYWAKIVYDGLTKDFPDIRPFTLMRSGFAGSQRFGMVAWSGDVSRSWGGFKPQAEISMQMAMQGIGYFHSDLGGFAGPYKDEELYTRWLQYGLFQPVFRPHAQEETPAEPVFWDEETKDRAQDIIELRYQMLPYNYSLAHNYAKDGIPFMTPLFFEEPDNTELYDYADAFLYGRDIVAVPVTEKGSTNAKVYLPKGSKWYSLFSLDQYEGGQEYEVELEMDYSPAFIREGAMLPMLPEVIQTTRDYSTQEIEVHYWWSDESSSFRMFDDDGSTRGSFEDGNYQYLNFSADPSDAGITFRLGSEGGDFDGKPESRNITFVVIGAPEELNSIQIGDEIREIDSIGNLYFVEINDWDGSEVEVKVN